jgi:hypothetical protein
MFSNRLIVGCGHNADPLSDHWPEWGRRRAYTLSNCTHPTSGPLVGQDHKLRPGRTVWLNPQCPHGRTRARISVKLIQLTTILTDTASGPLRYPPCSTANLYLPFKTLSKIRTRRSLLRNQNATFLSLCRADPYTQRAIDGDYESYHEAVEAIWDAWQRIISRPEAITSTGMQQWADIVTHNDRWY